MSIVRTIIVILSLWGLHASSFCQTYDWAAGASRPSGTANVICHPTGITNSYDKFTYSTGRFFTPASAFLNFGAFQLNTGGAFGVSYDVFLVKYDVNGNVVWARQAGSERDDRGHDVKCDTNNNIIVVGEFDSRLAPGGTADYFGIPIASQYAKDIFISKVAPNGAAIWSKSIGGDAAEGARGVAVDKNNNIYITGFMSDDPVDFGGGPMVGPGNYSQFFVAKYDPNGNYLWANVISGGNFDNAYDIAVCDNFVAVCGSFQGTTNHGANSISSNTGGPPSSDGFVTVFDLNGTHLWARNIYSDEGSTWDQVAIDSLDNIIVTGDVDGGATFPGSGITHTNNANTIQAIIGKYSSAGNLQWIDVIGNATDVTRGEGVTIDQQNNPFMLCWFDEDVNIGGSNVNVLGTMDYAVIKYDPAGNYLCHNHMGNAGHQMWAEDLSTDWANNVFVNGHAHSTTPHTLNFDGNQVNVDGKYGWFGKIDFPFPKWETDTLCESDNPINLDNLLDPCSDINGTWSGQGVTGNMFNPSGLSGDIPVTYSVGTNACDEDEETHDIHVKVSLDAVISGNVSICNGQPAPTVDIDIDPSTGPWTITYAINGTPQPPVISNVQNFDLTANSSGTYTLISVVSSDPEECPYNVSGSATVTVNSSPTASISGNINVCAGDPIPDIAILLAGGGPYTFEYSINGVGQGQLNANISPYTFTPSQTGTYTVSSVDNGCPGATSGAASVTINPAPQPGISGNLDFCQGTSVLLDAGGGFNNYSWSNGDITQSITTSTAGVYSVTVDDAIGCQGNASITINEIVPPEVINVNYTCNPSGSQYTIEFEIIDGDALTYAVTGVTGSLTSNTPYIFTSDPINSGTPYNISVTDGNGCGAYTLAGTYSCQSSTCPATATISGGGTICSGGATTVDLDFNLTGTPPWDLVYTDGTSNFVVNGINTSPHVIPVSAAGTYTIVSIDDANCTGSTFGSAIVNVSNNSVSISGPTEFCEGGSVVLDAGGGYSTYSWSDGISNIGITQSVVVSVAGTYTVDVTDAFGCQFNDNIIISENEKVQVSGLNVNCINNGADFEVSFEILDGDPSSYNVSGGTGNISANSPYIFTSDPIPSGSLYSFDIQDANSCNVITISGSRDCGCGATAQISGGGTLCPGGSGNASIDIVLGGTGPWNFVYFDGTNNIPVNNVNTSPYTFVPVSDGTYTLVSVEDATCSGGQVSGVAVVDNALTNIGITGSASICDGSSTILDAGSGFASYIWNTGDLTQSISASTSGNYVVTVTDNNGCSGIVNHNLTVESAVQVTASSFSCNLNNTQYQLQFEIIDGDPNTYNVSGMTGSLTSNSPYIFVGDPQNNGNSYNITVTDGNSCGTVNLVGSYNCGCAASASIDGGGVICSAGSNTQTSIDITLIGAPPWDIVYTDGVNNYPVNNILASPYSFNTSTPGTYTLISVADANCNAGSVSGYADVLISQNTPVISGPSSYCEGSTVTLDAGGGYSLYTWSDAAGIIGNNQSILVSSPGQYDLQVEDVHGCTFSDNVLLVEHEKVITSNLMVTCDPNGLNYVVSFEISGGDPTTYNVSGNTGSISGNGPYIFTSDPIASGVPYAFDVTDVNSCNTISLSGLRDCSCAADAVISGGGNICPGGGSTASIDVVLSGTGPWEITYFDGQNNTIVNNIFTSPYTFSPSSGGTFTLVSVSDANCLGGSVSGIAVVNEVVGSPTISGPNSFCEGNTIVLDAGLGYSSYVWSDGLNNLGTNQAINVNSGGAYFITATDLMGCVHNMSHNVTELQKIDILNLSSNCNISGADYVVSFEISNGDPTTYSVTGNPGTLTNSLPYIFTSAAITQGTPYNFVVEDGNQCNTQNISGSQSCQCAATAQISGGGIVCRDGSATTNITIDLTGTAPWDITYSDGSNNYNVTGILQSPHIIPVSDSGSYVLIDVTDANCSGGSVSGLAVVDYSNVQVGIFGPSEYCTGDQIILEALGGNFQSYLWSTNEITSSISVGLAGVFFVDAIDQYGCNSSDTVTVKENPRPIPVITGDKSYCKGNTALLDAGPGFLTYNWSNGVNTQTNNVEHGVYVVVVSDQNGCFGNSGPWEVFENDVPNVDIAGPEVLCGDQSVVLDATTAEADDYLWLHDNSIDSVAEVLVEGEFIVHASNHCGIGKDTINILKVELPEITLGPDRAYCAGDIGELIQLVAIEGASYQWFERSEELGFSANNILVKDTGLYSVSVFYQGCIVTDTLDMTSSKCKGYCEVYVPNAFTPDGTGLNEKFTPITLEQCQFDTYRFTVFNRWGDLLFTSQTPGEGWDGHFNGILSELGVYLWKLEYVDSNANVKEKRYGTVTLLR